MPKDSVARPSQDFREFVVAHSAESSRTAPTIRWKPALLLRLYEFLRRTDLFNSRLERYQQCETAGQQFAVVVGNITAEPVLSISVNLIHGKNSVEETIALFRR